jgi:hypothetical protein
VIENEFVLDNKEQSEEEPQPIRKKMDVPEINHMYKNVDEDKTYGSWVYVMEFYQDIIFKIFEHGVNYTHKKLLETTLKGIQAEKMPAEIMKKVNIIATSFKPPNES